MGLKRKDVTRTYTLVVIDLFYGDSLGRIGTCLRRKCLRVGAYWRFGLSILRRNRLSEESLKSFRIYTIIIYRVVLF
jgi:hypothetical protein